MIRMRRRAPNETVQPLQWIGKRGDALRASFLTLGQSIARWVSDHAKALRQQDPAIPEQLNDRAGDNWSPLLAIANEIGGEWPERACKAAIAISGTHEWNNDSVGIQLLIDIRAVFEENKNNNVKSQDLCMRLAAMEERSWATWNRGHSISAAQVARMLRQFEIRSHDLWIQDRGQKRCVKGYRRQDFEDTFSRYLPITPQPDGSKRENARDSTRSVDQATFPRAGSRVLAAKPSWGPPSEEKLRQLTEMWRYIKPIKEVINNE